MVSLRDEKGDVFDQNMDKIFFTEHTALAPCPHKKLNLVELVSVAESYLGSRFTVGVQSCRV